MRKRPLWGAFIIMKSGVSAMQRRFRPATVRGVSARRECVQGGEQGWFRSMKTARRSASRLSASCPCGFRRYDALRGIGRRTRGKKDKSRCSPALARFHTTLPVCLFCLFCHTSLRSLGKRRVFLYTRGRILSSILSIFTILHAITRFCKKNLRGR